MIRSWPLWFLPPSFGPEKKQRFLRQLRSTNRWPMHNYSETIFCFIFFLSNGNLFMFIIITDYKTPIRLRSKNTCPTGRTRASSCPPVSGNGHAEEHLHVTHFDQEAESLITRRLHIKPVLSSSALVYYIWGLLQQSLSFLFGISRFLRRTWADAIPRS